ncbi:hypothetical protein DER46DRAFT_580657 [Fusarium sp. MPI-SDFR-AT-0072]|nr:hypothetical protein DER46DRAFT_580657 [Fusarium sp. MPI-SDFR-AT-0072]
MPVALDYQARHSDSSGGQPLFQKLAPHYPSLYGVRQTLHFYQCKATNSPKILPRIIILHCGQRAGLHVDADLGAILSLISTDLRVFRVLQRLQQTAPRRVFMSDTALYNGKRNGLLGKMTEITAGLQKIPGFRGLISQAQLTPPQKHVSGIPTLQRLAEFVSKSNGRSELSFEKVHFQDPFFIIYSSGSTGTSCTLSVVHC